METFITTECMQTVIDGVDHEVCDFGGVIPYMTILIFGIGLFALSFWVGHKLISRTL